MSNADYAFQWLLKKGYAPHQAAGIVGNLVQESNVRPDGVVGDNGTAFGVAQWRGDRFAGLQRFAEAGGQDWRSLDTQLGYLDHELNTTERRAGDALRAAPDVRAATRAVIGFERPQGWTSADPEAGHGWANRFGAASALAGGSSQLTPLPQGSPGPYAPPAGPQQPTPDGSLGTALAMLAPENSSSMEPLTPPVKPAQIGPLNGIGVDDVDVSAFQPRTTRPGRPLPRRA